MGPNDPEQIHLALGGKGEMYVSWVTGEYAMSSTPPVTPSPTLKTQVGWSSCEEHGQVWHALPPSAPLACMQVKYGLLPEKLDQLASGEEVYYTTNNTGYTNFTSNNYVLSPTIHHVLLQGLLPNTIYFYA